MATEHNATDFSLLNGVDFRAFWETVRLRWWIIPAVVGVAVGLLWAQESDLRTEPASYVVAQTYEARDSTAILASVGIDPVSVRAFPDANNQLLILQSAEVRDEIAAQLGNDVVVTVARSRPTFTLVDTLESDGKSSFVFTSAGVPTYSYSCNEPVKADCETAIAAYVAKTVEIRREALTAGLEDLKAVLSEVQRTAPDAAVATKLAAIDVLIGRVDTPLLQISTYEEAVGTTVSTVRRPTYTFGVAVGLLIALLILLQLTYSDRRVRSVRQLTRLVGADRLLGHITKAEHGVNDRRTSVSVHHALTQAGADSIRYLPLRAETTDDVALARIANLSGATATFCAPFAELSVPQLTAVSTQQVDVIVVHRNHDLRADVLEVLAALNRSSRVLAGVVLVD